MSDLYSLAELEMISDGDKVFITKMKQIFEEEMLLSLDKLNKALAAGDHEIIKLTSHTMKPSIDNLMINSIREEIRMIESLGAARADLSTIAPLVAKVNSVLNEVIADMRASI